MIRNHYFLHSIFILKTIDKHNRISFLMILFKLDKIFHIWIKLFIYPPPQNFTLCIFCYFTALNLKTKIQIKLRIEWQIQMISGSVFPSLQSLCDHRFFQICLNAGTYSAMGWRQELCQKWGQTLLQTGAVHLFHYLQSLFEALIQVSHKGSKGLINPDLSKYITFSWVQSMHEFFPNSF